MPPTPRCTNDSRTSSCSWSSLRSASVSASSEPCTSALSTRFSVATSPRCTIAKMSSRRAPPASIIGCARLAARRRRGARLGDGAGDLVVGRDAQLVAGERHVVEAEHLDRHRRARFRRPRLPCSSNIARHLAPAAAGDDGLADAQRAALDERGDDRAAARVEVRLEHERARRRLRVGRESASSTSATSRIDVEQLVDAEALGRRRPRRRSCRRPTPRARAPARRAAGARGSGRRPRGRPW